MYKFREEVQGSPFLTNITGNSDAGGLQHTFLESPTYTNTSIRFKNCFYNLMMSIILKNEFEHFQT